MVTKAKDIRAQPLGDDFAERAEIIVQQSAGNMFQKIKAFRKVLGKRPYKGLPVDPEELKLRYQQVRRDKEALIPILAENVKVGQDGKMLISKELLRSVLKMEREIRGAILQSEEDS